MKPITTISQLTQYSNIEVFQLKGDQDKYVILYDDHRCLLNVLFEAEKLNMFPTTPNLISFDYHDDAVNPHISANELFARWNVERIEDVKSQDFWSFVEFDLSCIDDDWLLAGMELGLINNSVVIGADDPHNIKSMNNHFESTNGINHELYDIAHIDYSIENRGCLGDSCLKENYNNIRDIFEYNQPESYNSFSHEIRNPFVLDFDLDCFTTNCLDYTYAWPEIIFYEKYASPDVQNFMRELISRSTIVTICREPACCGGIGESNKILSYLDRYFFNGQLNTFPIK